MTNRHRPVLLYPVRTRILHWLTAILIVSALLIGFVMVNSIDSYSSLVRAHMTLGVLILSVVVIRAANRLTHRPPRSAGHRRPGRARRRRRLRVAVVCTDVGPATGRLGDGVGRRPAGGDIRIDAAPPHRTIRRRPLLRSPADPFTVRVCTGGRHRRARLCGVMAYVGVPRRHVVPHDIFTSA